MFFVIFHKIRKISIFLIIFHKNRNNINIYVIFHRNKEKYKYLKNIDIFYKRYKQNNIFNFS